MGMLCVHEKKKEVFRLGRPLSNLDHTSVAERYIFSRVEKDITRAGYQSGMERVLRHKSDGPRRALLLLSSGLRMSGTSPKAS